MLGRQAYCEHSLQNLTCVQVGAPAQALGGTCPAYLVYHVEPVSFLAGSPALLLSRPVLLLGACMALPAGHGSLKP
jgi:hypothetical protein